MPHAPKQCLEEARTCTLYYFFDKKIVSHVVVNISGVNRSATRWRGVWPVSVVEDIIAFEMLVSMHNPMLSDAIYLTGQSIFQIHYYTK